MSQAHKHTGVSYSLIFLIVGSLVSGCSRTQFNLDTQPKEIAPDGKITIALTSRYPPAGTHYVWYSDFGKCEPAETESPWTQYTAPHGTGHYRVTVEVKNGGRTLYSDSVEVNVLAAEDASQLMVPSPEQPEISDSTGLGKIRISQVPTYDPVGGPAAMEEIAGEVSGIETTGLRIVIYAFTDNWYVQPLVMAPFTDIQSDGKWSTQSHLGSRYAALVVKPNFKPQSIIPTLPLVGGDVVAVTTTQGKR